MTISPANHGMGILAVSRPGLAARPASAVNQQLDQAAAPATYALPTLATGAGTRVR